TRSLKFRHRNLDRSARADSAASVRIRRAVVVRVYAVAPCEDSSDGPYRLRRPLIHRHRVMAARTFAPLPSAKISIVFFPFMPGPRGYCFSPALWYINIPGIVLWLSHA